LGGLCWDFAGGRLGMPLAHPPSSWPICSGCRAVPAPNYKRRPSCASACSVPPPRPPPASRGRIPEGPRSAVPPVWIPFADAFQRLLTAHGKPGLCVVCLPAIRAFQRHSTHHFLHYRSPFAFHFCFRSVPSGFVQRIGCSACGLGHPHQVWWAPPIMYIAHVWSR
jgi:hypothetical protein